MTSGQIVKLICLAINIIWFGWMASNIGMAGAIFITGFILSIVGAITTIKFYWESWD